MLATAIRTHLALADHIPCFTWGVILIQLCSYFISQRSQTMKVNVVWKHDSLDETVKIEAFGYHTARQKK